MLFTPKIQDALDLTIRVHWLDDQQFRKGKDVPYLTHPLMVALLLARATNDEDVIIAGLLHDTIEDSDWNSPVTREMIAGQFGDRVAAIVHSVSEKDKGLDWQTRKHAALDEIDGFSHDELLVKSADLISNISEIAVDWREGGDNVFERFTASKQATLNHLHQAVQMILDRWPENPLANDLVEVATKIERMQSGD